MNAFDIDLELGDLLGDLGLEDSFSFDTSSGNGTNNFNQNNTNDLLSSILNEFTEGKMFLLLNIFLYNIDFIYQPYIAA